MTKRILVLTRYSRMGASSRLRTLQYLPLLEEQGFELTVKNLFDDNYLDKLYNNQGRSKSDIFKLYLKRFLTLFTAKSYDVIWIEKEIFPYMPAFAEQIFSLMNIKYIVDYDDAVFHNYDLSKNKLVRFLLSNKIDKVMKSSTYVLAGNSYLAEYAKDAGAKNIQLIPTVVDPIKYQKRQNSSTDVLTIGWIGSPSTQKYVVEILPELQKTYEYRSFRLVLVGASQDIVNDLPGLDVEVYDWDEKTEADLISLMDIGIMPLHDGPWEKGKCGYKLIQYMACGIPVVASDIGVNREIIENKTCGILATKRSDWSNALVSLLGSGELREKYGEEGRASVEQKYSLYIQMPIVRNILTSLVG